MDLYRPSRSTRTVLRQMDTPWAEVSCRLPASAVTGAEGWCDYTCPVKLTTGNQIYEMEFALVAAGMSGVRLSIERRRLQEVPYKVEVKLTLDNEPVHEIHGHIYDWYRRPANAGWSVDMGTLFLSSLVGKSTLRFSCRLARVEQQSIRVPTVTDRLIHPVRAAPIPNPQRAELPSGPQLDEIKSRPTDVSFLLPDGSIREAHRQLLAHFSPVFNTLFATGLVDPDNQILPLRKYSHGAYEILFDFMYGRADWSTLHDGEVDVWNEVARLATAFEVSALQDALDDRHERCMIGTGAGKMEVAP